VTGRRAEFVAARGFPLDPFQERAFDALDADANVVVSAPTGSGKTLVAEYAVERAHHRETKAFYTTPIKALSNQKFAEFRRRMGDDEVGLLTGDNSVRGRAPVVIMTTEVLRNMIYAQSPDLDHLGVVVLDEVHYLQDPERGAVWEEIIIQLPESVQLVCLSATVSNAHELGAWIEAVRGETVTVVEQRRPVPLEQWYAWGERHGDLSVVPMFVNGAPNSDALRRDEHSGRGPRGRARTRTRPPRRSELIEYLDDAHRLPGIVFVFSRNGCDQAVEQCRADGVRLTSAEERIEIRALAETRLAGLADQDLDALNYTTWLDALECGLAAHHAGLVPPMKEVVEAAFERALVKVVFATETLAVGINMPARTVAIERLTKFTGERHEFLTAGEYTQLTGRAGRRGLDPVGHALVSWSPWVPFEQVAALAGRSASALRSSFRLSASTVANLVARHPRERILEILGRSFAQFLSDRDIVGLERELDRRRKLLTHVSEIADSQSNPRAVKAAREVARLRRGIDRLEGRARRRRAHLGDQFDRWVEVLRSLGYVESWTLTSDGGVLAGLATESELLVAEAVRRGCFDDLDPAAVAALTSCATFQPRGRDARPMAWPSREVAARFAALEAVWRELTDRLAQASLPTPRPPDPGLCGEIHAWTSGAELADVLDGELTGGDFVRHAKQCIDLLQQLEGVAPPALARTARAAREAARRGIVEASSSVPEAGDPDAGNIKP